MTKEEYINSINNRFRKDWLKFDLKDPIYNIIDYTVKRLYVEKDYDSEIAKETYKQIERLMKCSDVKFD